jgi:hypothetical protein
MTLPFAFCTRVKNVVVIFFPPSRRAPSNTQVIGVGVIVGVSVAVGVGVSVGVTVGVSVGSGV